MSSLADKHVLLTGAAGGFGREFISQLLAKGARLTLTDRDVSWLEAERKNLECSTSGRILDVIPSDLSTVDGPKSLFDAVSSPVDVLINNAGMGSTGRHDETPVEVWKTLTQVNLVAAMELCSLFTPQMIERGDGHIVNICSISSWVPIQGCAAYAASKHGLRGFSDSIAQELAGHGICVSIVHPYYSRTPMMEGAIHGSYEEHAEQRERIKVTEPVDVVAATIAGIEAERTHIFPDMRGRLIYRTLRISPTLCKTLARIGVF